MPFSHHPCPSPRRAWRSGAVGAGVAGAADRQRLPLPRGACSAGRPLRQKQCCQEVQRQAKRLYQWGWKVMAPWALASLRRQHQGEGILGEAEQTLATVLIQCQEQSQKCSSPQMSAGDRIQDAHCS